LWLKKEFKNRNIRLSLGKRQDILYDDRYKSLVRTKNICYNLTNNYKVLRNKLILINLKFCGMTKYWRWEELSNVWWGYCEFKKFNISNKIFCYDFLWHSFVKGICKKAYLFKWKRTSEFINNMYMWM